jgi:hypothetical protein
MRKIRNQTSKEVKIKGLSFRGWPFHKARIIEAGEIGPL